MPRYLQMGRIDVMASMEEEFNDWLTTSATSRVRTCKSRVYPCRRFVAIEAQPKYLPFYEFENPGVPDTKGNGGAMRESNPWSRRVRAGHAPR